MPNHPCCLPSHSNWKNNLKKYKSSNFTMRSTYQRQILNNYTSKAKIVGVSMASQMEPVKLFYKQECIPVGCVPPTHWPYVVVHVRGVHGSGACVAGGHEWQGACVVGKGMRGRGCAWQGGCMVCVCVAGGCMEGGHTWHKHPLWTDRHLWKHNLLKLRLRAVKIWQIWHFRLIT